MAFLRNLRQNVHNLQDIFKKKKRSTSSVLSGTEADAENSENIPVRASPGQDQGASASDRCDHVTMGQQLSKAEADESQPGTRAGAAQDAKQDRGPEADEESPDDDAVSNSKGGTVEDGPPPCSNPVFMNSDPEAEDSGVSLCQCVAQSSAASAQTVLGQSPAPTSLTAEEFYGYRDLPDLWWSPADRNRISVPSTSQQTPERPPPSRKRFNTDTGQSSLEEQMEEMVSKLKTRGSLSRRRSRSRSRRSRARQSCEGGVTMSNVRIVQAFPIRETDSDDSNTESRTSFSDIPLSFFSTTQQNAPAFSNNQSNSSFHSATENDGRATPQTSSATRKAAVAAAAEEEEEGEGVGRQEEDGGEQSAQGANGAADNGAADNGAADNGAADNRRGNERSIMQQIQEIYSYGPEEFVLDLLLAMCRGSWSDIL